MLSETKQLVFVLAFLMSLSIPMNAESKTPKSESADTIFVNGRIWGAVKSMTAAGRNPDGTVRWFVGWGPYDSIQAIAVRGDRIVAVGSDEEIKKLKGSKTHVVDLGGHFVMPGFNDAHLHLAGGGFEKLNVNLVGVRSLDEMKQRIAERARAAHPGEWLEGRGWDHTMWPGGRLPSRQDLDAVTAAHPAILTRIDGHIAVANTAALNAAGITRATKDPVGGKFDHDEQGELTGIVREDSAMDLIRAKVPPPTPEKRRRTIELALADAAQWGITSVQDNSNWEDYLVYEELNREGKLTVRITEWLPFEADLKTLQLHRAHHPATDPMLHTGMLKGFLDGSLGSRTAALLAPYSDDPTNKGLPRYTQATLNDMARERIEAGFQMGFHAIGDGAAQLALTAFEEAQRYSRERGGKSNDFRNRIEHFQVAAPGQVEQMARLGVIASVQPNHLLTDMNWAEDRIGAERAKLSYPWRSAQQHGVPLAFGTDYPVEPITPFRGIYSAVTRKSEAGTKSYYADQKIDIVSALSAYTSGAAYAEFAEKDKGTLEKGKLADFVVLDRDLLTIPPEQILATKVLRTVVGGKTVYDSTHATDKK
jgi:predicted amidohydrolase YtcJ